MMGDIVIVKKGSGKAPGRNLLAELIKNRTAYIMCLPCVLLLFVFNYLPMGALIIAFKNYKFNEGIFGSEWASPIYENIRFFFTSGYAFRVTRNTILLNLVFIASGVVFEVGFALMLTEIGSGVFKKLAQGFSFFPNFVSWIVVSVITYNLFKNNGGSINTLLVSLGQKRQDWYSNPGVWPLIMTLLIRWKGTGAGAIIYLASIVGIDTEYYEAAKIDGATRFKQITHITLPLLAPTVIIMTLLAIGHIMNADFGMFYSIIGENARLYPTMDVIDTFVFRSLRKYGDVGMSSATGLYQSVISFILVLASNMLARKYDRGAALF